MKSIIQDTKECFLTQRRNNLHSHHIFHGSYKRKMSEKYGLKIWLTAELHENLHGKNGSSFDLKLKQMAQTKAMEHYNWSIEDFIRIFGKNYLE